MAVRRHALRSFLICASLALAGILVGTGGCGRGTSVPMYPVSGAVTFDGSPVEKGSITFDAVDNRSPPVMGGIENGRYEVRVPAGEKIVRIDAVRSAERQDQYGSQVFESFIPREFNEASKLRATISPNEANEVDIVMKSGKAVAR